MDVSFEEDLTPGTVIKHARARKMGPVIEKRVSCDTGDGDEWDNDNRVVRVRSSEPVEFETSDFEFIDDVIAYKIT